jgi:hypothetical protein
MTDAKCQVSREHVYRKTGNRGTTAEWLNV